jgi:hypothetical protein
VTVFVSRKPGSNLIYYKPRFDIKNWTEYGTVNWDWTANPLFVNLEWPRPVKVKVSKGARADILIITNNEELTFINDGYTVLDNTTGKMYRVLERREDNAIVLDRPWGSGSNPEYVWVVPAPIGGTGPFIAQGRRPCIAVYQRVMRF